MLAKSKSVVTMKITSICKQFVTLQQMRYLKFSTSSSFLAAPTVEQISSRSKIKLNRNRNVNSLAADDKHDKDPQSNIDYDSPVHIRRLKMRRIIENAEDLLGYRLHRLNNSLLLNSLNPSPKNPNNYTSSFEDEAKVILSSIQKLEGSEHPLLSYAKGVNPANLEESDILTSSFQLRSMIVLLVAKSFGLSKTLLNDDDTEAKDSAMLKQRTLAEITEIIYSAHMLHQTVVEIPTNEFPALGKVEEFSSSELPKTKGVSMHYGNKIATLIGDLLLARSSKGLASLRNARVTELMSDSIADFTESEIIVSMARDTLTSQRTSNTCNSHDNVNNTRTYDSVIVLNYEKWLRRSSLSIGSLLRHSCFSSLVFGGHDDEVSIIASKIGHKIGLAVQAYKDFTIFENKENLSQQFDWCSLPVIFHLEKHPNLTSAIADNHQMLEEVRNSPYAVARTREKLLVLSEDAISLLDNLSIPNPSCKLLKEFLTSLTES